jgi:hypothetical protein
MPFTPADDERLNSLAAISPHAGSGCLVTEAFTMLSIGALHFRFLNVCGAYWSA